MTAMCAPENYRSCSPTPRSATVWAWFGRRRGALGDSWAGDRLRLHGASNWALFVCLAVFLASAAIRSAARPGEDASIVTGRDASASLLDLALEAGARTAMPSECRVYST